MLCWYFIVLHDDLYLYCNGDGKGNGDGDSESIVWYGISFHGMALYGVVCNVM